MSLIVILFFIIIFILLLNYIIDLFFYIKNRLCRFHIGRWTKKEWELAIQNKAEKVGKNSSYCKNYR